MRTTARHPARALAALLLAALALAPAPGARLAAMPATDVVPPQRHFTFRFAPRDGSTWIETERITRMTQAGLMPRRVLAQEARTRVTARRTKTGWRMEHEVLSVKMTRDGVDASELFAGLVGVRIALVTDTRGQLLKIEGMEGVVRALGKGLPAFAGFALEAFADRGKLEADLREEWTDRIAYFSGMQAEIGQIWVGQGKLGSVHGPINYHAATRVTERMPCGDGSCVRMRFASHVDPRGLAKISPEAAEKAREGEVAIPPEKRLVEFSSEGERIIDPSTMMMRRERVFKTTRVWVDMPLIGRTAITNEEQSETTWTY